jgi:hypothetical protein
MRTAALALSLSLAFASSSLAQQCLHGEGETPEQTARRREALNAARLVNTLQANQPGVSSGRYLSHAELAGAAPGLPASIRLAPGQDIATGWRLTLDVTPKGYWFAIKDTTDPCAFTFVSNEAGVILRAEPIR